MLARPSSRAGVAVVTVVAVFLAVLVVFAGRAEAASITLGQTGNSPSPSNCSGPASLLQTAVSSGNSYTVPSGHWTITSWSTEAGAGGGDMALIVFRSTGTADEYTVVAESALEPLTGSTLNTFTVSIDVEGGDLIGYACSNGTLGLFHTGDAGDTFESGPASPSVGSTYTFTPGSGDRLDISVTATEVKSGSTGTSKPKPPPPPPSRVGVCDRMNVFRDILLSQYQTTDTESPYYGAVAAKYAEGIGITCDNLPGYTDAGYTVDGTGTRAPAGLEDVSFAPYEYYTKNA
jgi:hypothetical protein